MTMSRLLILPKVTTANVSSGNSTRSGFVGSPITPEPFFIGIVTGGLSGFFGIGGGPFQISTLIVFFGLDIKEASVDSIFITFLTTISSLTKYTLNGYADFSLAVYMIPAAILGGYIGSRLNRKINEKKIALIFISSVLLILAVQTYIVIT